MQTWILWVDFMCFLLWMPAAPMEWLQYGPTGIQIPRLTKKLSSAIFWFHIVLRFQLELRVEAVTAKPKIHVGLTEVRNCRATTSSCHLWIPHFYTLVMCKPFWSVTGGKTLEGLNWSGMQKGFTSKPFFCSLKSFLQCLMHENGLCCVLLCMDLSVELNMQRTIGLCSLMISSVSVWGVMEDSTKDQRILIDTPSVIVLSKILKLKKKKKVIIFSAVYSLPRVTARHSHSYNTLIFHRSRT